MAFSSILTEKMELKVATRCPLFFFPTTIPLRLYNIVWVDYKVNLSVKSSLWSKQAANNETHQDLQN